MGGNVSGGYADRCGRLAPIRVDVCRILLGKNAHTAHTFTISVSFVTGYVFGFQATTPEAKYKLKSNRKYRIVEKNYKNN